VDKVLISVEKVLISVSFFVILASRL